jgi:ubiquitin C-terminal hydrolase
VTVWKLPPDDGPASVFAGLTQPLTKKPFLPSQRLAFEWRARFTTTRGDQILLDDHLIAVLNSEVQCCRSRLACNLHPPSPAAAPVTLGACFAYLSEPEVLDENNQWYCQHCRTFVCAEKQVDIWKVPEVLILHLKRFINGRSGVVKADAFIDFPDRINLRQFIAGPQGDMDQEYLLFAVCNHRGSIGGGHYTAHAVVQDPRLPPNEKRKWYAFNDDSVSEAQNGAWHSAQAYLLFYERSPGVLAEASDDEDEDHEASPEEGMSFRSGR